MHRDHLGPAAGPGRTLQRGAAVPHGARAACPERGLPWVSAGALPGRRGRVRRAELLSRGVAASRLRCRPGARPCLCGDCCRGTGASVWPGLRFPGGRSRWTFPRDSGPQGSAVGSALCPRPRRPRLEVLRPHAPACGRPGLAVPAAGGPRRSSWRNPAPLTDLETGWVTVSLLRFGRREGGALFSPARGTLYVSVCAPIWAKLFPGGVGGRSGVPPGPLTAPAPLVEGPGLPPGTCGGSLAEEPRGGPHGGPFCAVYLSPARRRAPNHRGLQV